MTQDKLSVVVTILMATTATALGAPQTVSPQHSDDSDDAAQCPDAVRGVSMTIEKRAGGVTIDFKTKQKDQVTALQHLLREAATLVEHHSKLVALHPELVDNSTQMLALPAMLVNHSRIASARLGRVLYCGSLPSIS